MTHKLPDVLNLSPTLRTCFAQVSSPVCSVIFRRCEHLATRTCPNNFSWSLKQKSESGPCARHSWWNGDSDADVPPNPYPPPLPSKAQIFGADLRKGWGREGIRASWIGERYPTPPFFRGGKKRGFSGAGPWDLKTLDPPQPSPPLRLVL